MPNDYQNLLHLAFPAPAEAPRYLTPATLGAHAAFEGVRGTDRRGPGGNDGCNRPDSHAVRVPGPARSLQTLTG